MLSVATRPHSLIRPSSLSFSQNHRLPTSSATAVAPHPRHHSLISRSSSVPPPSLDQPITTGDDDNELVSDSDDNFEIDIEKVEGKRNRRRIRSTIGVDAELDTVWRVLTDYEGLARFIPSVAVSRILDRKDKFAKLYQVGEQNLALGLTFKAKGVLDCYEGDIEISELSRRRDIEFKMVEGDFQTFEGRWSIQQLRLLFFRGHNKIVQQARISAQSVADLSSSSAEITLSTLCWPLARRSQTSDCQIPTYFFLSNFSISNHASLFTIFNMSTNVGISCLFVRTEHTALPRIKEL